MDMRRLSPRQQHILEYIHQYVREHGYPPSVREIGRAVGLKSSSTVHGHLARLEAHGFLRRDASKPRAIELLHIPGHRRRTGGAGAARAPRVRHVPLLGRVAAGQPILAVQDPESTFPLPSAWVGDEPVFMLRVQGDSMIDAGILSGDLLVVRQQDTAADGDIVVALLDDDVTVKRFFREAQRIRLQPANQHMEPIYTNQVRILGRVIGLMRQY